MASKKTLVLGASLKPDRYSNFVINRLQISDNEVVALGNISGQVSNVTIETECVHFENIDTITLYLNRKRQVQFYDYIVSLKPKRVIFNPGTENPELYKILEENDISFEVACTLVLLSTNQY